MFCREAPKWPQYLLDFGLVLKQNLKQGSREGGVGQQWDGGGCPKKACRWRKHHSPQSQKRSPPPAPSSLTLLGSRYHRVKQHLQGGRIIEACEYLHDCGVREQPLPPVHSLETEHKVENEHQLAAARRGATVKLVRVRRYHRLGSDEGSQHASSGNTRSAERHPDVGPSQEPAVGEPPRLLSHLGRGELQHREAPEASVLALSQLRRHSEI